jgi:nucleoside phosphorylase
MPEPTIDIGILTIRDDEFRAVLKVFPSDPDIFKGRYREYALRTADGGQGRRYRMAILRQIEQGNGEAQDAARDLIDDLRPSLLVVVGIAGGLPSGDLSLGDVVLSTRIVDFSLEARKFRDETTYNVGGGPIPKAIAAGIANLSAREADLGDWWTDLPPKPKVSLSGRKQFYGPTKWQRAVRESLQAHYGRGIGARPPLFTAGTVASSDRLVKDPRLLLPWISTSRGIQAIEMESAGVHRATRDNTPMLAIRGLSDIVGFKRHDAWTKYACAAAAAFTCAYLRTTPVAHREPPPVPGAVPLAGGKPAPTARASPATTEQEAFANLIPLRQFPQTLYVGPALCRTMKQGWALLRKGMRGAPHQQPYLPGAWTLFENNVYSFADPEQCRLGRIIDIGGLDSFETSSWAFSADDNKRRLFVYLLNAALRDDLWAHGVRYHGDQDVFAFMGHPEDEPRTLRYANVKVRSTATVVAHYEGTSARGKSYPYLRHAAFQGRFRLLGGQWYLEITPTYRFTHDGKALDRFHERKLSGIKRIERNRSVLSQLLVWQAVLRAPWIRADRPRLLEFAPLLSFRFLSAIDESRLTALDAPTILPTGDEERD